MHINEPNFDRLRQEETTRVAPQHPGCQPSPSRMLCNRYELLHEVGHGSWGVVFLCRDTFNDTHVAVKPIPPEFARDEKAMGNMRANFDRATALKHPGIASLNVLERDYESMGYFLVTEYVEGEHLQSYFREIRSIPLSQILDLAEELASALDYAHAAGVVHRDIKPSNIQRTPSGHFKLLDFGVCCDLQQSLQHLERLPPKSVRTCAYMAPEQWNRGSVTGATDQYALAASIYETFEGRPPFPAQGVRALKDRILHDKVPSISGLRDSSNEVLARALSKDPSDRFETCKQFSEALRNSFQDVVV